jgi:hypothetical protein
MQLLTAPGQAQGLAPTKNPETFARKSPTHSLESLRHIRSKVSDTFARKCLTRLFDR